MTNNPLRHCGLYLKLYVGSERIKLKVTLMQFSFILLHFDMTGVCFLLQWKMVPMFTSFLLKEEINYISSLH